MERGVGPWMDFHRVTQAFDLGWYEAGPLALSRNHAIETQCLPGLFA